MVCRSLRFDQKVHRNPESQCDESDQEQASDAMKELVCVRTLLSGPALQTVQTADFRILVSRFGNKMSQTPFPCVSSHWRQTDSHASGLFRYRASRGLLPKKLPAGRYSG